ncbi:MAG TPA: Lrp/AsnC ligand binding domain-containing protein [Nitrospiria bacterium]
MALSAIVLVNVTGDHTKSAYKTITRMEGVKSVYAITGSHDLVIFVETENVETLGDLVLSRIRSIDGVTKTITNLVLQI